MKDSDFNYYFGTSSYNGQIFHQRIRNSVLSLAKTILDLHAAFVLQFFAQCLKCSVLKISRIELAWNKFSIIYMELYRSSLDFWRTDIDKFDIFPTFRLDIMSVVWITSALCQIANNFIWKDLYYCPLMLSRIFNQRLNSFAIQNIKIQYFWYLPMKEHRTL